MANNNNILPHDYENKTLFGIPQRSTSAVWKNFRCRKVDGMLDTKTALCVFCNTEVAYGENCSVSNLKKHLKNHHAGAYETFKLATHYSFVDSNKKRKVQATIPETLNRAEDNLRSEMERRMEKTHKLNTHLVRFICGSLSSFRIVDDPDLKACFKLMDPDYLYPNRKIVSSILLDEEYSKLKQKEDAVIRVFDGPISLTTDLWTSRDVTSYITLTIHWMDGKFNLVSKNLTAQELPVKHEAKHIAAAIKTILATHGIHLSRVTACITDNASNMIAAVTKELNLISLPCFAHTLHLAVKDGLALVGDLLNKCRAVVSFFNKSTVATMALKQAVAAEATVSWSKLIQDVVTRWTSTYKMLRRLSEAQPYVTKILQANRKAPQLTSVDWDLVRGVAVLLKPFYEIMVKTQAEQYITLSMVVPLLQDLRRVHLTLEPEDDEIYHKIVAEMVSSLNARFHLSMDSCHLELLASALDPRFKNLIFISNPTLKAQIWEQLEAETKELESKADEILESGRALSTEEELMLLKDPLHDEYSVLFQSEIWKVRDNGISQAKLEIDSWRMELPIATSANPVTWWRTNQHKYPLLTKMAQKYLSIPATSAPSERAFSVLGQVIDDNRSRLSSKKVQKVFFIHENL